MENVLIGGQWRASEAVEKFQTVNPATKEQLPKEFPVSTRREMEQALVHAASASEQMDGWPGGRFGDFLDAFAVEIEAQQEPLVATAHNETGLPKTPRLGEVEFKRTTGQLRQAAEAARSGEWAMPTVDRNANIRSMYEPIGPVVVFGPNNFPFAFNSMAGGDFAAAVAAGNPVIAKAHHSHPDTTRLFAECALRAAQKMNMPDGFVQLLYHIQEADARALVSDPRIGATGYTGSRRFGLTLKDAADRAGKLIYLEMGSTNPVFLLRGALRERLEEIAGEFVTSALMGAGQFCTNPGIVIVEQGDDAEKFLKDITQRFEAAPQGTLLNESVQLGCIQNVDLLQQKAGAEIVTGGTVGTGGGYSSRNTLLKVQGDAFLNAPDVLQTEVFGPSSLVVVAKDSHQMADIARALEGNLTGTIYSSREGADDALYSEIAPLLRRKVGRLLNDKMPTGVAVSPAMNHGGPYPASGHPGFTSVGMPQSIHRFAKLTSYDNVRPNRLPDALKD